MLDALQFVAFDATALCSRPWDVKNGFHPTWIALHLRPARLLLGLTLPNPLYPSIFSLEMALERETSPSQRRTSRAGLFLPFPCSLR